MSEDPGTPGQIIADRYELIALIGRGGMGCVWRARHRTLRTPVAVKLIAPSVADREGVLARFLREAQSAATLRGTNVIHILDHGVDNGIPYMAMEYLEGESLGARLRRVGKLTPPETAKVLTGVVRAISRAHRAAIVHRDLKPDNVFLTRDEDAGGEIVKVLDFGIAKIVDDGRVDREPDPSGSEASTVTGAMLGTPYYMSPEQARGKKDLDARSDLWSIAVIAFECLTGRRPFDAPVLGELVMQICAEPIAVPSEVGPVPAGFDAWFALATQRDPAARFQNVRELAAALSAILTPGNAWLETRDEDDRSSLPSIDPGLARTLAVDTPQLPSTQSTLNATTGQASTRSVLPEQGTSRRSAATPGQRVWLVGVGVVAVAALGIVFLWPRPASPPVATSRTEPSAPAPVTAASMNIAISTAAPEIASAPAASSSTVDAASAAPSAKPKALPRQPVTKPSSAPAATVNLGI